MPIGWPWWKISRRCTHSPAGGPTPSHGTSFQFASRLRPMESSTAFWLRNRFEHFLDHRPVDFPDRHRQRLGQAIRLHSRVVLEIRALPMLRGVVDVDRSEEHTSALQSPY